MSTSATASGQCIFDKNRPPFSELGHAFLEFINNALLLRATYAY